MKRATHPEKGEQNEARDGRLRLRPMRRGTPMANGRIGASWPPLEEKMARRF